MTPHPADQLMRRLLEQRRAATSDELAQIVERLAGAPFDQRVISSPVHLRGRAYRGRVIETRADALLLHLFKRVVEEQQWVSGTTAADYIGDVGQAVRHRTGRAMLDTR